MNYESYSNFLELNKIKQSRQENIRIKQDRWKSEQIQNGQIKNITANQRKIRQEKKRQGRDDALKTKIKFD